MNRRRNNSIEVIEMEELNVDYPFWESVLLTVLLVFLGMIVIVVTQM